MKYRISLSDHVMNMVFLKIIRFSDYLAHPCTVTQLYHMLCSGQVLAKKACEHQVPCRLLGLSSGGQSNYNKVNKPLGIGGKLILSGTWGNGSSQGWECRSWSQPGWEENNRFSLQALMDRTHYINMASFYLGVLLIGLTYTADTDNFSQILWM